MHKSLKRINSLEFPIFYLVTFLIVNEQCVNKNAGETNEWMRLIMGLKFATN